MGVRMVGVLDYISQRIEKSGLIDVHKINEFYGIPTSALIDMQTMLPELALLSREKLPKVAREGILGLVVPYSGDELTEAGVTLSPQYRDCVDSSIDNKLAWPFNQEKGMLSLGTLISSNLNWLKKLEEIQQTTAQIGGTILYQYHIPYSLNGNPNGSYRTSDVVEEIKGNLQAFEKLVKSNTPYLHPTRDPVWAKFKELKGMPEQELYCNFLVEKYIPFVHNQAEFVCVLLPDHFFNEHFEDLVAAGTFALFRTLEPFDLNRGNKFETYASKRVIGEMLDEATKKTGIPKSIFGEVSQIWRIIEETRCLHGRRASDSDIAEGLGLPMDQYDEFKKKFRIFIQSAEYLGHHTGLTSTRNLNPLVPKPKRSFTDPFTEVARRDTYQFCLDNLTEKERSLIDAHYIRGMSIKEIAMLNQSPPSTTFAQHRAIIRKLRRLVEVEEYNTRGRRRRAVDVMRYIANKYTTLGVLTSAASTSEVPEPTVREMVISNETTRNLITKKRHGFIVTRENLPKIIEVLNQFTNR